MRFLSLFFCFLASVAVAQSPKAEKLCIVISGKEHDKNNFLDEELFAQGQKVAGVDCKVFGNWSEAVNYAKTNLKKEGKLLVVQGAHGDNDGTYDLNDGKISSHEIYTHLKDLSQTFHVGSVIHSCFSASIMNEKLMDDEESQNRLDKLCLVSSSSFGRVTYSHKNDIIQNLLRLKPGENLEQPFIHNRGGVISSAPWSDIGLPEYLVARKTGEDLLRSLDKGFKALENMDAIMRDAQGCNTLGEANMALCMSPTITDETYEDIMSFMDPKIPRDHKNYFLSNFKLHIKEFQETLKNDPKNSQALHGVKCQEEILRTYIERFGEKLENLTYYPEVMVLRDEIMGLPIYKTDCIPYLETIKDKDEWYAKSLITESFHNGIEEYGKSLERLERKYTKRKFDETFDLYEFATAAAQEKRACSLEEREKIIQKKETMIQSVFGDAFYWAEYDDGSPDEMLFNTPVSTQTILKGFQDKALKKASFESPKDTARRKACQEFSF